MNGRMKEKGPGAAATAHRAKDVVSAKPTISTNTNDPPESSLFEVRYRDRLWRFSLTTFNGNERLSVWQHYRDRESGEWKPCGGRCRCGVVRESPGFVISPDLFGDLLMALEPLQLRVVSQAA